MRPAPVAFLGLLACLTLVQNQAAAASTASGSDLADLVAQAEQVLEVEVLATRSEMRADGRIETVYTFATITPMKGLVPAVYETRLPGGQVAGRGLILPGLPALAAGDRSVLFLSKRSEATGWRMPVGLGAGCFHVRGLAGERQVVRAIPARDGSPDVRDYAGFLSEVLAEVARQDG